MPKVGSSRAKTVAAPKKPGSRKHKALGPAPGEYVHVK